MWLPSPAWPSSPTFPEFEIISSSSPLPQQPSKHLRRSGSKMPSGIFNSSYYGKDYRAGAALLRARRPYLVKNSLTGLGLFGFVVGVYAFTIRAVGQEDFSDVVVPDAPPVAAANNKQ